MPFEIKTDTICYLLPEDGKVAEKEFLLHLHNPGETWIIAFGFTLAPMVDELISAHNEGVRLHLYLDHSQSSGRAEKAQVQRLVDANVEVTIGTSPEGSRYICHTKGVVVDDKPPWCWEGSVNFSESGWHQVNTAMVFSSGEWRDRFVEQFKGLRQFAWTRERNIQVMQSPPNGVT